MLIIIATGMVQLGRDNTEYIRFCMMVVVYLQQGLEKDIINNWNGNFCYDFTKIRCLPVNNSTTLELLSGFFQFVSGLNLSSVVLCPDPPPPSSKYGVTTSPRFPGQLNTVPELNQLSSQGQFPDSDEICKECHHSCKNKLNMLGLTSLNPLLPAIIDTSGILSRTMSIMFFVNLVGTMSFIVWRLMMMASMITSTGYLIPLLFSPNVDLLSGQCSSLSHQLSYFRHQLLAELYGPLQIAPA